jgi:hypothetical protein
LLWLFHDVTVGTLSNCMLTCALPACRLLLGRLLLARSSFRAQGCGHHTDTEPYFTTARTVTSAKAAQCFATKNGARQCTSSPSPTGTEQKQVAESGGFAWSIHTPPLSSLVLSPLYPAPSRVPSKRGAALPSLLLSPSRFPCKRTNNKQSLAFQSAHSFLLPCSCSRS